MSHLALDIKRMLWKYRGWVTLTWTKQWEWCCRRIQKNWESHLKPTELIYIGYYQLPLRSLLLPESKKQFLQWPTLRSSHQNVPLLRKPATLPPFPQPVRDSKHTTALIETLALLEMPFLLLQFSSVAPSCPILWDPMNRSTPGLPVYHQLPKFTQTHIHRVSDATQPSHPLSSPSPPAPNPSQLQSLFQWVNSSHEVARVLEFQL